MLFSIIFFFSLNFSSQQEISNLIKIFVSKSPSLSFYINAFLDKNNSIILPLKLELNSLTTSIKCKNIPLSKENFIMCSDNLCYKLFYDEKKCEQSQENKCSFIYENNYGYFKNYSGIYINHYFNIFTNDINFIERSNILPIGCLEENLDLFNENISGIFSLGGNIYSFLPYFYKANEFNDNNALFSICIDPQEGGYLTIGNITNKYHLNNDLPINFRYEIKDSYYIFKINNMFFNYENFNKEEYNAIFNMNTEYTYVNKIIINDLYHLFKNYLTEKLIKNFQLDVSIKNDNLISNGICFINNNIKDKQFKEKLIIIFPPLFIGIDNKYYKWESEYYLYKSKNNKEEYCIGILSNEKKLENKKEIEFGANFMYGHEFIFNFIKNEIFVYESNCSMKPRKKFDLNLESKYGKINGYLKVIIIILIIIFVFLIFIVCRLSKKRSCLCIKLFGKKVTNEEINQFFNSNYNVIK